MVVERVVRRSILCAVGVLATAAAAWTWVANGWVWPGSHPRVPYQVSTSFQASSLYTGTYQDVIDAVNSAAQEWNDAGSELRFEYRGETSVQDIADDGINAMILKDEQCPHGGACFAAIYYHLSGTDMKGFDIVFYTTRGDGLPTNYTAAGLPFPNQTHFRTTALHELGHAVGLAHTTVPGVAMNPGGYGYVTVVSFDDIAGAIAVNGAYTNEGFWADNTSPPAGTWVNLTLDYGESAGLAYEIRVGTTGSTPGWPLTNLSAGDSRVLPINEPFLDTSSPAQFVGFAGTLDGSGKATAQMLVPLGSTETYSLSVLTFDPSSPSGIFDVGVSVELKALEPTNYCTAGTSASGCQASLSATGVASATAPSGFALSASTVEGAKDGLFFFGVNGRQASPWGNGSSLQCVVPPVKRAGLLSATGTPGLCDGSFTQDLNALWSAKPAKNPGSGATVQAQLWHRDPQNTSNRTTSLSDAIEFGVGP